jgi:hypothetical protein
MDRITHCPTCGKRRVPVVTLSGRTDLQCKVCRATNTTPAISNARNPRAARQRSRQCTGDIVHWALQSCRWSRPPFVVLTLTDVRNKIGLLIDAGQIVQESVVRARIVTTMENIVALRDMLNTMIQENPATSGASPRYKLN